MAPNLTVTLLCLIGGFSLVFSTSAVVIVLRSRWGRPGNSKPSEPAGSRAAPVGLVHGIERHALFGE